MRREYLSGAADDITLHLGGFPTPVGEIPPTGNRIDVPTADLWHLRDGKIERFDCYNAANVLLAQIGVRPDFDSAIEAARTAAAGRSSIN